MNILHFMIAWANAPFTVAGGVALLFALLSATGVMGLLAGGEGDGDHDVDHEVDHDVDGGDHDADHDADQDQDAERGASGAILGGLGFGRLPFSLIWQSYAMIFAVVGLSLNAHYVGSEGGPPLYSLAWSLPSALVVGYIAVAILAKLLGPLFSTKAQEATSRAQLIGQMGVVISSKVSSDFGEVRIKDKTGFDIRVVCKLAPGQREIREAESVVVIEYDEVKGDLLVAPLDIDADVIRKSAKKRVAKAAPKPDEPPDAEPESESSKLRRS